jgi:TfoX N-terminal domain
MQMPRHSDEAKHHFRSLISEAPGVEVKPMFGSLGAFVHGNMFAGLFGEDIGVKLDETGMTELGAMDGTGPFGPAERPMSGWLSLPARMDDADKSRWTDRAREHLASMPPKVRRPKKK